jgi:hypothetical protein
VVFGVVTLCSLVGVNNQSFIGMCHLNLSGFVDNPDD